MLDDTRLRTSGGYAKIVVRLFDKAQAKLELYKLEKKFTRRKHRATFAGEVEYIDGEYVYRTSHKL